VSEQSFSQGVRVDRAGPHGEATFAEAIAAAVDYRGDVTLDRREGRIEGYLFDVRADRGELRLLPADGRGRTVVPLAEVTAIEFSGKDAASGKTWENWVRRYVERKLAGKSANLESESLDG